MPASACEAMPSGAIPEDESTERPGIRPAVGGTPALAGRKSTPGTCVPRRIAPDGRFSSWPAHAQLSRRRARRGGLRAGLRPRGGRARERPGGPHPGGAGAGPAGATEPLLRVFEPVALELVEAAGVGDGDTVL